MSIRVIEAYQDQDISRYTKMHLHTDLHTENVVRPEKAPARAARPVAALAPRGGLGSDLRVKVREPGVAPGVKSSELSHLSLLLFGLWLVSFINCSA